MIRLARDADVEVMRAVEAAAGRVFAEVGMDLVADDEPLPAAELLGYLQAGRAWVATDEADRAVAYLIAAWIDGVVHVEQVSVHPDHAGRRIGADLIEHVAQWARQQGSAALTLTTYAEVAWNGPYYERLGFRPLGDAELTPGLREIRTVEAARGLDAWPRIGMRRDLGRP